MCGVHSQFADRDADQAAEVNAALEHGTLRHKPFSKHLIDSNPGKGEQNVTPEAWSARARVWVLRLFLVIHIIQIK